MRIKIISVGKVRQDFVKLGEAEYLDRLSKWTKVEMLELNAQAADSLPASDARREEGKAVLSRVKDDEFLVVLDERGKQFTSELFSKLIGDRTTSGASVVNFAIGGPHGWDDSVRKRANILVSLSPLTFPFQLSRLILVEQLYRAFTLLNGIPYHK